MRKNRTSYFPTTLELVMTGDYGCCETESEASQFLDFLRDHGIEIDEDGAEFEGVLAPRLYTTVFFGGHESYEQDLDPSGDVFENLVDQWRETQRV